MTLLFADGFDSYITADFTKLYNGTNGSPTISAGNGRTGACLRATVTASATPTYILYSNINVTGELVVGFAVKPTDISNNIGEADALITFYSTTGMEGFLHTNSVLGLIYRRGTSVSSTGTVIATSSVGLTLNTWSFVEVKVRFSDTVGSVQIRVNGVTTASISAVDTAITSGVTTIVAVALGMFPQSSNTESCDFDDFYLCDTNGTVNNDFLGDISIKTLLPNGNGNSSQLVGSDSNSTDNYLLVDEASVDTADYVTSSTADQFDTYTFSDLSGSPTVKAVVLAPVAAKSDAGGRKLAGMVRHSATNYTSSDKTVGIGIISVPVIYETNPGTSAIWTITEVNNAEFGVKVR